MSDSAQTFQLSTEAAEVYEQKFVPALFGEWAAYLVDAADPRPGQAVLDVACGTGVVARAVADRLGGSGRVVGVDRNKGMLAVARRIRPDLEWHHGDAADLPFPAASFDLALCQAALMYFPDRVKALTEMARVVTAEGTVAVQVWASLESQPAYRPFAKIAARHAGPQAIDLIASYFCLGDLNVVTGLFDQAGLAVSATRTRLGAVRFGSIDEFVAAEVESTPLIDLIDDDVYARIRKDSRDALGHFRARDGRTELPIEGHVITARKR
jgi:SAM-dependent methyltransferase